MLKPRENKVETIAACITFLRHHRRRHAVANAASAPIAVNSIALH